MARSARAATVGEALHAARRTVGEREGVEGEGVGVGDVSWRDSMDNEGPRPSILRRSPRARLGLSEREIFASQSQWPAIISE